jgi:hypothetical protein
MTRVVPLVIATLVAIAVALSLSFLAPQFARPAREEALDIIDAVGEYEFLSIAAEYGVEPGLSMPEAETVGKVRVLDAAPCGEIAEPVKCHPIEIEQKSEMGRMLAGSWQDASKLIADRGKEAGRLTESFEESASPASEYLLGLQISASRRQDRQIVPSGLTDALVRQHVKLRADTPQGDVRTYFSPWVVGDTAFVQVDLACGDMCGTGTGYALRKTNGKWRVIAVQNRWIA